MSNAQDTSPLTDEELKELTEHRFYPEPIDQIQKDIDWQTNVINNSPKSDPAHARFSAERKASCRYLELMKRYTANHLSED